MSYKPTTEVDAWVQLWDRARIGAAISIDMVNLHLLTFFYFADHHIDVKMC